MAVLESGGATESSHTQPCPGPGERQGWRGGKGHDVHTGITQRYPYLSRAGLLAKMDTKAARRGFTSWDEDDDGESVVPLVLGARPGTREYWRDFKDLHLDSFEGFPQAALEHLPSKMLNSLTCTDSLADLFKKKGGLFAPSRP